VQIWLLRRAARRQALAARSCPVGGGVNAENIRRCLEYLHGRGWDGVVSIECHGSDENTQSSVKWMREVVKGITTKRRAK
jgi:sugar phosphate isomerase/epimerase